MKKTTIAFSLAMIVLVSANAQAEQETLAQQAQRIAQTAGKTIDNSVQQATNYVDDSTLTARVKKRITER
ncbi:hypothetical protein OS42_27980 [Dickeya oryzae]